MHFGCGTVPTAKISLGTPFPRVPIGTEHCYYTSVVRPVLEYSCVVWNTSITQEQAHRLDSIQKRAETIIGLQQTTDKLTPLKERRDGQSKSFFESLFDPTNCLHDILPPRRDAAVTDRLRHANVYTVPFARTERYRRSFIINALNNFQ